MDWRLLVKERIANIGISLGVLGFFAILMNVCVLTFFGFFGPPEKLISLGVPVDGRPLVKEHINNLGISLGFLGFGYFNEFLCLNFFWVFWSLGTNLLCIMCEVSWGGSVVVAVGNNDR